MGPRRAFQIRFAPTLSFAKTSSDSFNGLSESADGLPPGEGR